MVREFCEIIKLERESAFSNFDQGNIHHFKTLIWKLRCFQGYVLLSTYVVLFTYWSRPFRSSLSSCTGVLLMVFFYVLYRYACSSSTTSPWVRWVKAIGTEPPFNNCKHCVHLFKSEIKFVQTGVCCFCLITVLSVPKVLHLFVFQTELHPWDGVQLAIKVDFQCWTGLLWRHSQTPVRSSR